MEAIAHWCSMTTFLQYNPYHSWDSYKLSVKWLPHGITIKKNIWWRQSSHWKSAAGHCRPQWLVFRAKIRLVLAQILPVCRVSRCWGNFGKLVCHVDLPSWAVPYTDRNWFDAEVSYYLPCWSMFSYTLRSLNVSCEDVVLRHDHREGCGCNGQDCSAFPSACGDTSVQVLCRWYLSSGARRPGKNCNICPDNSLVEAAIILQARKAGWLVVF